MVSGPTGFTWYNCRATAAATVAVNGGLWTLGLKSHFATPNPFVSNNRICLNQVIRARFCCEFVDIVNACSVMRSSHKEQCAVCVNIVAEIQVVKQCAKSHYPPGNHHASHF